MHRIIQSYLKTFVEENAISPKITEDRQFEIFANYCVIRSFYPEEFDATLITSDDVDTGIDGICFFIDGEIVTTLMEAKEILRRPKRTIPVTIYFIQSKSGDTYDKGEILKFGQGVSDFIAEKSELPQGDFVQKQKEIFDLLIENVSKIQNGRANARLRYITNSNNSIAQEIDATKLTILRELQNSGIFNEISFEYIGLNELISLWDKTRNSITAVFQTKQLAPYPSMPAVSEAYLAIVPLKEYVEKILMDEDHNLRVHIFEDNVRSFLGNNSVNKLIKETLSSEKEQDRFGILNNGITIIASDVRVQNDKISIENYQIVNGCQTSNILFENYDLLRSNAMITVRVIEAHDSDVIAEVVRATNSQSKVEETQFLSYEQIIRRIEKYFDATEDIPGKEVKLYFERRIAQYKNADIPKRRVFSIPETCRAVGAMFLNKPEMAYRYPTRMIATESVKLLNPKNKEIVFYTAAIALYRFKLLTSNGKIDQKYFIHKWHILLILSFVGWKKKALPPITNKKIEIFCKGIISACSKSDDECLALFKEATDVLDTVGLRSSRDEIRSQTYTQTILEYCNKYFR